MRARICARSLANACADTLADRPRALVEPGIDHVALDVRSKQFGRGVALLERGRDRLAADLEQGHGYIFDCEIRQLMGDEPTHDRVLVDAVPQPAAREHLPQHHAGGEQIGASIHDVAAGLLR